MNIFRIHLVWNEMCGTITSVVQSVVFDCLLFINVFVMLKDDWVFIYIKRRNSCNKFYSFENRLAWKYRLAVSIWAVCYFSRYATNLLSITCQNLSCHRKVGCYEFETNVLRLSRQRELRSTQYFGSECVSFGMFSSH